MGNYQKSNNQRQSSQQSNDSQKSNKEYVNGIFVSKREGAYGEFFSVGIKKEEFINNIQAIEEDEKGFINLTMTGQKTNPNKMSVYVNAWKPGSNEPSYQEPAPKQTASKPAPKKTSGDDIDSLPF